MQGDFTEIKYNGFLRDESIINNLQQDKIPILVYGVGNIGLLVSEFLQKRGIEIKGFIIDDLYYREYKDLAVYRKSQVDELFESYNVVMGMAGYHLAEKKLKNQKNVKNIYCIANPCSYLEKKVITWEFFMQNRSRFRLSYDYLADYKSKEIFVAYLNTLLNLDYRYLMGLQSGITYFDNDMYKVSNYESYVDCGAYNGDSIENFVKHTQGRYQKIYAIEPDDKNFEALKQSVVKNKWENVSLHNVGIWSRKDVLKFAGEHEQESGMQLDNPEKDSCIEIGVDKLDNLIKEPVSFIKMSIQSSEYEALLGAENIIEHNKPVIAMTIFMNQNALIKIPQYIKSKWPGYQLYLRCEDPFWIRVILYAVYNKESQEEIV